MLYSGGNAAWNCCLSYTPPLRRLSNCLSLVRKNVTVHCPGVPENAPPRCAIVRGHCPPNYNLPIPASGGSGGAAVGDELQGRHDDSQSNAAEVSDGAG